MNLELNGQRVLITGGSKGIGLAIAKAFAAEGAKPVLVSRDQANLTHAVQSIEAEYKISDYLPRRDSYTETVGAGGVLHRQHEGAKA